MGFEDQPQSDANHWGPLRDDLMTELDELQRALQDINMKLKQSQAEVSRLVKRNTSITTRLQQDQNRLDAMSLKEVRSIYDAALGAQQRLFVMRGQVDKLQSDKKHLQAHKDSLESIARLLENGDLDQATAANKDAFNVIEASIQSQEAERQRLSRQMHDGPAQALSNFILQAEIVMRCFNDDNIDRARSELIDLKKSANSAFQQVRNFVFELRPMMLDDLGLVPTLKRYVESFKQRTETQINLDITGVERRFESYIEVIVFRSIQELLVFAQHQGQATQMKVRVDIGDANVKVSVTDNGKGFDDDTIFKSSGLSIKAIRDRIKMLGGYMDVDSEPGQGGYIVFQVPLDISSQAVFADS